MTADDTQSGSGAPSADPPAQAAQAGPADTDCIRPKPPVPRWVALIFLVVCIALIPQIISLSSSLTQVQLANHWRVAWVGLDITEALVFLLTAWFLYRGSPLVSVTASIAFAMLWLDAWFDVMTSISAHDIAVSRTLAVFAELPLGVFCLVVAIRPLKGLMRRR